VRASLMEMTRRGVVAVVASLVLVATVALITSKDGGDAVLQSYRTSGRMMPPMMQTMQAPRQMPVNSFAVERATANALDNDLNNFLSRPTQPAARRMPHKAAPRHEMAPTEQLLETSEDPQHCGHGVPRQLPPFDCDNPDPKFTHANDPYATLYPNDPANSPVEDPIASMTSMSVGSADVDETIQEGLNEAESESETSPESSDSPQMMNPNAAAAMDETIGDEQADEFNKSDEQISEIDKEYEEAEQEEAATVAPAATPTAVTDEITNAGISHVSSPTPMVQEASPTPEPSPTPPGNAHGFWGGGGAAGGDGGPPPVVASPPPPSTNDPAPDSTAPQRSGCGGSVPDQLAPFDCSNPDPKFSNEPYSDSAQEDPLVHHQAASTLTETRHSIKTAPAGGAKAAALKVQKAADNKIAQLKQATQVKELKYKKALALVKQTSQDIKGH